MAVYHFLHLVGLCLARRHLLGAALGRGQGLKFRFCCMGSRKGYQLSMRFWFMRSIRAMDSDPFEGTNSGYVPGKHKDGSFEL